MTHSNTSTARRSARKSKLRGREDGFRPAVVALAVLAGATGLLTQPAAGNSAPAVPVQLYTLDCGLTEFRDADIFSDTGEYKGKPLALPAPCYLIHHANDWMLWDTGLSDKLAGKPLQAYGGRFSVHRTLAAQLAQIGLKPSDVRYVGLSHLHLDHTGNIAMFPQSTLPIAAPELAWAGGKPRPFGVDPALDVVLEKAKIDQVSGDRDVFGDGTVTILKTPGHTPGHQSLLLRLPHTGNVLITGDLYHTRQSYEKHLIPIVNDRAQTMASMDRFARIQKNTSARVVIEHDPQDFAHMPAFPKFLN